MSKPAPGPGEEHLLRDLAARQAITDVLHAYCAYLDKMDLDALVALFTQDCSVDYGPQPRLRSHGAADLRHDLERMWRWARTSHHLSNVTIVLDPDGSRAEARSYVLAWHERPDGSTATMMGQYEDTLVLRDGRWLIATRRQVLNGNDSGFDVGINRFTRLPPH